MRNQARIIEDLRRCCMVRGVDVLPEGHLRVETKFLYPDGSFVDVFVVDDPREPLLPPRTLSDFAQTTAFLLDNNVKPWASPKRRAQLADVLSLYGVERRGGELCLDFDPQNTAMLGERVIVLGQACLRMSDFILTTRPQLQSEFTDDVTNFFTNSHLRFERAVALDGRYSPIEVDFLVQGKKTTSAILTLFSRMRSAAHRQATEVFTKVHDLETAGRPEQRVTLVDDAEGALKLYRPEDLRRIQQYSDVVPFSERATVRDRLAA